MQILEQCKSSDDINPNQVVIYEGDKKKLMEELSKENFRSDLMVFYHADELQSNIDIFFKIIKKYRTRYGPYGNFYKMKFFIIIDNFNKLLGGMNPTETYAKIEKQLGETFISVIL